MLLKDIDEQNYCHYGKKYSRLRQSNIKRLKFAPQYLWRYGFYDGPLSGICLHENKKCYFRCVDKVTLEDGDDYDDGRVFVVVELSNEDIKNVEEHQNFERKYEGVFNEYRYENGKRHRTEYKPPTNMNFRLEKKPKLKLRSFQNNKVIAWYGENHFDFDAALMKNIIS